jgi:hypothetical protein
VLTLVTKNKRRDAVPVSFAPLHRVKLIVFQADHEAGDKGLPQKLPIADAGTGTTSNKTGRQHLFTATLHHLIEQCNRKCTHDD